MTPQYRDIWSRMNEEERRAEIWAWVKDVGGVLVAIPCFVALMYFMPLIVEFGWSLWDRAMLLWSVVL